MNELMDKVYSVYETELPTRIVYNATVVSPTSVRAILNKFKSWDKFEEAYKEYCDAKGTQPAKKTIVTKPMTSKVTKK